MALPVISIAQMREWEKATWAAGQSEAEVIRLVGRVVGKRALQLTRPGEAVLILAGKGHNGEDARCAHEHLAERRVTVLDVKDPQMDLVQLEPLLSLRPALIIDGLFGIGLNRPLDSVWIKFIERINASRLPVLAVDVPSGLNADTGEPQGAAIQAMLTLTVGAPKRGMLSQSAWPYVGRLELAANVGLVPCPQNSKINWTLPGDFHDFPPRREVAAHKGTHGHLAILAGSLGFHGAAVMAARGAQRAQPGLITLYTSENVYHVAAAQLQAVMVHSRAPGLTFPGPHSALLIGPGLAAPGVVEEMQLIVRRLWRDLPLPIIVDASALDWLPLGPTPRNGVRVLTPHPGEAARLLKTTSQRAQADRVQALREISSQFGNCWVVLKGHQTLIGRSAGELFVNSSGNPFLAQGGTGDVLSGYLAGLLAQPHLQGDPLTALRFGVWQHGATADCLQSTRPNWVVEDLISALGLARPECLEPLTCVGAA
jgi:NAD(P)H-hydrate epimerase